MSQPTICIGTLGHVANGKSSLVRELTQKTTQRYKDEKNTNRTIKIGYANCKIFKCNCKDPYCYKSFPETETSPYCIECEEIGTLMKYVSFIDSPGHNSFMVTMLSGVCGIDSAILVFAASNQQFPAPQTLIHLAVSSLLDIANPIMVLNKVDLVNKNTAKEKLDIIRETVKGTVFEESSVIPISANLGVGIHHICKHIASLEDKQIPKTSNCTMLVVSSFNVNKQGLAIDTLKGGVIGGSIITGSLKKNDEVTILPGLVKGTRKTLAYSPLVANVVSIKTEKKQLEEATVGGLIAVELSIDPSLTTQDGLIGSIVYTESNDDYTPLRQITVIDYVSLPNACIKKGQIVTVTCLSRAARCEVKSSKDTIKIVAIDTPILAKHGSRVVISKEIKGEIVVAGFGDVEDGVVCSLY